MDEELQQATEIIKRGGIVVFPTDTAFGVGCRMDDKKAVARLFKIRSRPETQAVPVLVSSIEMAQKYLLPIPNDVKNLMEKYWPGALTIVLPCKTESVPSLVRGQGLTLGVRMADHLVPLSIINSIGVPILGPSANFHGRPTPYKYEELDPEFTKLVDYVVPGECPTGMVSTVIDCSIKPWKIIRQGGVGL
ncbi:threonylcarbamoyl-AMP synthase [Candidatus Gottesmanbacteria bacterium]|nr:threonylcarbamoyl-AMP synthase [Candidatus Gottesmanbacteria bacterium]